MADPAEPVRSEPVFRLVQDTTDFSPWMRFLLALDAGFIEPYRPDQNVSLN